MPTPKRYETPADRQRASRQRQAQAREQEHQHKGFPTAPALATLPSQRRWQSLMEHARAVLMTTQTEMQSYSDARSEGWQESERGETLLERIAALESLLLELDALL